MQRNSFVFLFDSLGKLNNPTVVFTIVRSLIATNLSFECDNSLHLHRSSAEAELEGPSDDVRACDRSGLSVASFCACSHVHPFDFGVRHRSSQTLYVLFGFVSGKDFAVDCNLSGRRESGVESAMEVIFA